MLRSKTWSSLSIFFLAMVLHPECQVRAQEEIKAIIGSERLPIFEDRSSLPYVESILQETLRFVFHIFGSVSELIP
jgi:cytochrome P450